MKRWLRRIVIAAVLIALVAGILFEVATHVGRGWLSGEPFYQGRPASYWATEIERWQTQAPTWQLFRRYERRPPSPQWVERLLPEPVWPGLLDGDPEGLAVLQALRKHPSSEVQDWARIGIERIDNGERDRGPYKTNDPPVIVTAQLYEVDEAFYKQVASAKWQSTADIEELERIFIEHIEAKQPAKESLFALLGKQQPFGDEKKVKLEVDQGALLMSLTKEVKCGPNPVQVRKSQKGPQTIEVGMTLRIHVEVSRDRRFVRMKIIEKDTQVDGIDKVSVFDEKNLEAVAEIPYLRESTSSLMRQAPDGGTLLLPLQYRPDSTKEKGRWLVARIEARIYIMEEEERAIQAQHGK